MVGGSKKKLSDEAAKDGYLVDPLEGLQVSFDSYDVSRLVSVYPDSLGEKWWTKAWFNGKDKGENSIEINRQLAVAFIREEIKRDDWLSRFFPKQMSIIKKALESTRNQLLGV